MTIGQSLSFNVNATDPEGGPLSYSLDVAPTGATISASGGLFSWTPGPAYESTTNNVTVRATDSGSLSSTRSFTITVYPRPRGGITRSGSNVALSFGTIIGKTYRVEYRADLNGNPQTGWTTLGSTFVANNTTTTINDPVGGNTQRFYRLVQLD
jgi:hypothetical protein